MKLNNISTSSQKRTRDPVGMEEHADVTLNYLAWLTYLGNVMYHFCKLIYYGGPGTM